LIDTLRFSGYDFHKSNLFEEWFMPNNLSSFFNAKGVALVGASASSSKLSHGILRNLIQYGYAGQIYPVNPKADEILGLQCLCGYFQRAGSG
jgi:hypothetical protein